MSTLKRPKAKLAAAIAISMALTTLRVFPAMIDSAVAAEVCRGPAAYPPDLPGCLDPVVIAQQAAAAAAAEASASASRALVAAAASASAAAAAAAASASAAAAAAVCFSAICLSFLTMM